MASVTMPQLGESITEGTISKWLKQPGDQVKKYDSLVEVITDKVNAEVPSPLAGTLTEIKVPEGTTVAVGTEICVIEEVAAKIPSASKNIPSPVKTLPSASKGESGNIPSPAKTLPSPLEGEGQGGGVADQGGGASELTLAPGSQGDGRTRLSPAVRTLLEEHRVSEIELADIHGSGIGGRISKKDVEEYLAKGRQPREEEPEDRSGGSVTASPGLSVASPKPGEAARLSPMRRAIAINMTKSKQTIPHAWTVTEVDMTNVVRQRQRAKETFRQREGVDLTFVPIVIKGVVEALRATPILNASFADDRVIVHQDINIGLAVSIEDGLIVPVIRNADRLSIAGIARAVEDLAGRARAGKLTLQDVQGATFTVNNPGTFGTVLSYSIIAPPQAAILAMDAIIKRPVVVDGDAIAIRSIMNLCLSFDHRVLDGVSAASFLRGVRRFLEGFSEQVPLY
jgi:2-oxoisovalerate dehydrogenase E2 component (dihydrolipoyl transacylase)